MPERRKATARAQRKCAGCEARKETIAELRAVIADLTKAVAEAGARTVVVSGEQPREPEMPSPMERMQELARQPTLTSAEEAELEALGAKRLPNILDAFDRVHGEGAMDSLINANREDAARWLRQEMGDA